MSAPSPLHRLPAFLSWSCLALAAGCGGSGAGSGGAVGGPQGAVGELRALPDGSGLYLVDDHRGGRRTRLGLVEVTWGRLVDVHDLDESGDVRVEPLLRNVVVDENRISDGVDYRLETNAITLASRLVVLRTHGAPDDGRGTFADLLRAAERDLAPVLAHPGTEDAPGPVSLVPRNATLVLRFDDLLAGDVDAADLAFLVRVVSGYPPATPFSARVLLDPSHGGLSKGAFRSTRVLVDLTVSEAEALEAPGVLPIEVEGAPASSTERGGANLAVRLPTLVSAAAGQLAVLRSSGGAPLAPAPGPGAGPTADVVRAFRAGNPADPNGGVLLDPDPPRLLGSWRVEVEGAEDLGLGRFLLDLSFPTACAVEPTPGHLLALGARFLEVIAAGEAGAGSSYVGVETVLLAGTPVRGPTDLLGAGRYRLPFDPASRVDRGCWVAFVPPPGVGPTRGVSTRSSVEVRFSEPIQLDTVGSLDSLRIVRGGVGTRVDARSIVVGTLTASEDQRTFTLRPELPLDDAGPDYHLQLASGPLGPLDLAGNALRDGLGDLGFVLREDETVVPNGGVGLRFASLDELDPPGAPDFRGQLTIDTSREVVRGRPVEFGSVAADKSVPTVGIMAPFGPGVQTPLSPLGCRLHAVWRYADFGWSVFDESKYDLDVTGLSWSPARDTPLADFFPLFEIRLGHSRWLPDEACTAGNGPFYGASGLVSGPMLFADDELLDPVGGMRVVHPASRGYRVDPAELYLSPSEVPMMPFPLNRGPGPLTTFTWRDRAALARGGDLGAGIPMAIEVGAPLFLETGRGSLAPEGEVPTIGLPLLWEIRCFPTSAGLGLNPFRVRIACPNWPTPNFRCYSTGGFDTSGSRVEVDPATEERPRGGFNPASRPPGRRTRSADNTFYEGQLDYVVRVSRAYSIWIDTGLAAATFGQVVVEPPPERQPPGTRVVVELRGATEFVGAGDEPFDASLLDPYGDVRSGSVVLVDPTGGWSDDPQALAGARWFQVRLSFLGNVGSRETPELDSLGIAYQLR